jgi:guanosine-3',5'-bis(diphosphate) 3'-pyrophosphohydrolase
MKDKLYNEFCQYVKESGRPYQVDKIKTAYKMAEDAHQGQKRNSGESYIIHPIHVAMILVELGMDTDCICAALLHDVVEDTPVTKEDVKREFGEEVAEMVDGVTKLGKIPLSSREEQQAENIRKMLLAMYKDIRVIIIKLADRLHNMRTLQFKPEKKQRETALETMEIYAPIANRLGIMAVKEELEDRALYFLDPIAYREIQENLEKRANGRTAVIESIKKRILDRLSEYDIHPHIEGRVKSIYGIYRKVYVAGREFDEVYDIYAVRIIVDTDIECYNILGIVHDMFTPIPNRFKDYISTPKPNMYQSLHTTVLGKEGIPFEIQIRTWDMHYTAEYGIAAHWKYKEGVQGKDRLEDRLAWVRRLIESQQESEGAEDIVKTIKTDLTPEEIYAFTPKGDVKCLPAGSTVIDFAYAIHSEVGNKMIGAKADGKIVSLEHRVRNGQIIEILTTKSITHGPNKEWLSIAKTSEARSKIRAWFKKERREENIIEGKMELDKELKKNYIHLDEEGYQDLIAKLCKRYNREEDDLYAAIGYGGIILSKIMPNLKESYVKMIKQQENEALEERAQLMTKPKLTGDISVQGIDNCDVKFSQCCNPLPGDEIIGFVTRGHGLSIHKRDCINVINSMKDPEQRDRWIAVNWTGEVAENYNCTLDIIAKDRDALFADISLALANMRVPIHEISARQLKNGNAIIVATISTQGIEHLKNIIYKLGKIPSVISVERSGK